MLRLRPYQDTDAARILSWQREERAFYRWSAGRLGSFPPARDCLDGLGELMRFTALDGTEPAGFFTLRNPDGSPEEVRFGFVVVDPEKRGRGLGREMLRLGLVFARDVFRARRATLAVFRNNEPAHRCYLAAGFRDIEGDETYPVLGEVWHCTEMALDFPEAG